MKRTLIIGALVIVVLAIGSYVTFEHFKEKPPSWLIGLLTKTEEPPPLPEGVDAPLTVPEGFKATIYARDIPGARDITRDQNGTMLVSLTKGGKVVALPDTDGDGVSDETVTVLEGLKQPHGILVRCTSADSCTLYVAETGELKSYAYDADTYTATFLDTLATFPTGDGHYTRTLLEHPDGQHLLISVGSSCNVCDETEPKRATVQSLNLSTGAIATYATGLRNTVFMATNPVDGTIWGTDNGRDVIGDDIPPDEVNVLRPGADYGWPICYGKNVIDTDFESSKGNSCDASIPSTIDLPAHSAALGLAFVPEEGWPEEMWHDLIIAYHGSWNRSEPTGYKVVRIDLSRNATYTGGAQTDFVTGFLAEGAKESEAIGRPVDVYIEPGGVMYISDDRAGAVYRIARTSLD